MRYPCFILFLVLPVFFSAGAQHLTNPRAQWFTEARFGMFIHWGVYSGAEGIWKGEKHRDDNNYAEWIFYRNRISRQEYLTLLDRFDWDSIDPEEWAILAKKSGMKYVTITAKHHDGFGLWDSQVSDYDVGNYTAPKRDIIAELARACQKHGLKLGLYYSHWVDWEHEYGWDHTKELTGITPEQYDRYWQEKVIPQIRELLTGYGDIGLLWFDMWTHHSNTVVTKKQLLQLKGLIRELQPNCLVNSRLGLSVKEDRDVDFQTLGDNRLGDSKKDFPWQSPATVAHSWGFHARDTRWKSTTTLLRSLINNVSLNGNFMLNIGPRADGSVPFEISRRMLDMGKWLAVNGESIYGAGAHDLVKIQHDWGRTTCRMSDTENRLYLHILNWPLNRQLYLTGISDRPAKIYALADKQKAALDFVHNGVLTHIRLPALAPDPYVSVLVVDYDTRPRTVTGLVAKTVDGGYSLTPRNQNPEDSDLKIQPKQRRGTVPEHVPVKKNTTFRWKIYVEKPATIIADVSYSYQGEKDNTNIVLRAAKARLEHTVAPTGKTIGEPNRDWVIDNFKCSRIGEIEFSQKGIYDVGLDIVPAGNQEIKFQWLWLK